ncbi:T9SS type B sorting domain-containing protein [Aquimarina brevivitae]|uniref:Gliding motility-associated-like protein n=1 Tax=Aquimarina brevivitae TaxID=323412 RepID=A0A4Q7PHP9_9FLAO|nr:T9SS type B sorting domain-containing protein [Aquimarina brevivitae]RZT00087.1 gliding motility-associated-like protein [Aquimarina brevivitae]
MNKSVPQINILFYFLFAIQFTGVAQIDQECRASQPFCSDAAQELTFANTTGDLDGLGEIGCLNTTPNPSWYFLRIDEPGELVFDIQQWVDANTNNRLDRNERQLDVDFIAWGPFQTSFVDCDVLARGCDLNGDDENIRPAECVNNVDDPEFYIQDLDTENITDCSYARTPEENIFTETFTIPNAQTGEYYIILITNFADEAGVIQLQQTNLGEEGAGTTDCSVLEDGVGPDVATCGNFPVFIQGRFSGAIAYQWYRDDGSGNFVIITGATEPFLEVNQNGIYQLRGYSDAGRTNELGRDDLIVQDVSSAITVVLPTVMEESFSGSYTITTELTLIPEVEAGDFTDFEYSLYRDIGAGFNEYRPFQESPVFENVPPGDYRVIARYANCPASEVESDILVILGYPKYFTPNGDSIHDTWTLINIEDQPSALIFIFDRSGKLLKQLIPGGPGWDGTFNGKLMPSSEYWFRVEFNEPTDPNMRRRVFAGSFSLIR